MIFPLFEAQLLQLLDLLFQRDNFLVAALVGVGDGFVFRVEGVLVLRKRIALTELPGLHAEILAILVKHSVTFLNSVCQRVLCDENFQDFSVASLDAETACKV